MARLPLSCLARTWGDADLNRHRRDSRAMLWLAGLTVSVVGACVFVFAPQLVRIFTGDPATISYGIGFLRALSFGAPIFALYNVIAGALAGAGDTRTPFYATLVSQSCVMLGLSYLLGIPLGLGIVGVFAGLVADYVVRGVWVAHRFVLGRWIEEAERMIQERRRPAGGN